MDSILKKLQETRERNRLNEESKDKNYQDYLMKMRDNVTYKKLDALCSENGYLLRHAVVNRGTIEINITSVDRHPEIYYDYKKYGEVVNQFRIQTFSVGALTLEEYEEYLANCNDAFKLVKAIKKIDLNTLYTIEEEEE